MNPSVAVLLVLAGYYVLIPAANAESGQREDGYGQKPQRPYYLENNHGQLAPYGTGELRRESRALDDPGRERYFRERRLRERWTFGPERYQQDGFEPDRRYGEPDSRRYEGYGDRGYRYYLRPFGNRHHEQEPVDFGRFSIQIDDKHEPASTLYYELPVSPRVER